ncbi:MULTISPECIES: hypothetical protein [Paraburkholderia]|uniref:Uncharacterized protein n=1 Tax=Paraburkholderia madseniana TaxID=2599607 RepID=A0AAP5ESZ7_9BURK|nr:MULTISPECIES: hypothetical protein [Paraburkholderia]MCX4152002.1 hypothetical protein [Paraburkholderia madseniana]MCX4176914.1 hypothetical protein [Paraburkholderia madseniana]MDN7154930.1 hypothetical protein [Paraburkholderia sp. WS6]MDQ6413813.1 hypothetical protein [Paraburkholderia madseniana]MDQ6464905.1 hypothetical protein [Paraburkholderia madseniana]
MLKRILEFLDARKVAAQQSKLVSAGMEHGRTVGTVIVSHTTVVRLEDASFMPNQGAALCGYIYGFSDVACQHVGLDRGGLASVNAAVTALNMAVAPDKASQMIDLFFVKGEQKSEFERGMQMGASGANGWLNKERWSDGLRAVVAPLIGER